jgi:hypothetical protein
MLAGFWFADPQLRMLAAAPMDRQDDLARGFVDIGDNVGDQGAQQPLARAHSDAWGIPCGVEIGRQAGEVWRDDRRIGRLRRLQPRLTGLDATQRRLPILLKLRGD